MVARPTPSAPCGAVQSLVAGDDGDDGAEDEGLDQARRDVVQIGVVKHVVPEAGGIDAQEEGADHVGGKDADANGAGSEQRHDGHHGQETRHDEIIDRVGGQGAQGVNLLGHAHGAQFGGDGRADAPGDHQAGQDRAEFAAHADADDGEGGGVHLDLVELEIGLGAEDHAGEGAGDGDDGLGFDADEVHFVEDVAPDGFDLAKGGKDVAAKKRTASQAAEPFVDELFGQSCHSTAPTLRRVQRISQRGNEPPGGGATVRFSWREPWGRRRRFA